MRLLIVEDDLMIGQALREAMVDAGHAADWVQDGSQAIHALNLDAYDALLLDLGLGAVDGVDVLRALRANDASTPVIVVTARDQPGASVDLLDLGADDYVLKPFDVPELLARLRAVARRSTGPGTPLLVAGALTLDPATREARFRDARCALSGREFALMEALVRRPGVILSRAELEARIYGWDQDVESNTVEVLVHGLRRKLGAAAIRTVRGAGYVVDRSS